MSQPRGRAAHPLPPADLAGFPTRRVDGRWFRAHVDRGGKDHGCWWFAGIAAGTDPDAAGRFDLPLPDGTCYLASTEAAAARERLGSLIRKVAGRESVLSSVLAVDRADVVVSVAELRQPVQAANLAVKAAERWVERSLSAGAGYAVPQAWAAAWRAGGLGGVLYLPRFTGGSRVRALAAFGRAGRPRPLPDVPASRPIAEVLRDEGVRVVAPPATAPDVLGAQESPPAL